MMPRLLRLKRLNIGVIGYGYWGPNLVRNFRELSATHVAMLADLDERRLEQATDRYPDLPTTQDVSRLLTSKVDGVVVATPVSTHFSIARDCLLHGKHVLVEKPLAQTVAQAQTLVDLAAERDLTLMVGHTFVYSPAVEMLKLIVESGELGEIYYIHSSRTNLGLFQRDINVIWDLAPHDISILLYVLGRMPTSVSSSGASLLQEDVHDVARMTIDFPGRVQAHVHVSWLDPCKVRRLTVVGSKKMAVYDDVEAVEKLRIYDKSVERSDVGEGYTRISYKHGDITIPVVPQQEPLRVECMQFADSIRSGADSRSSGGDGLKVVKVLEAAQRSLLGGGQRETIA
ncbi:MAG: Gfo/Idh/MocA family oxidoreductase [Anaerolineae bacterium]